MCQHRTTPYLWTRQLWGLHRRPWRMGGVKGWRNCWGQKESPPSGPSWEGVGQLLPSDCPDTLGRAQVTAPPTLSCCCCGRGATLRALWLSLQAAVGVNRTICHSGGKRTIIPLLSWVSLSPHSTSSIFIYTVAALAPLENVTILSSASPPFSSLTL